MTSWGRMVAPASSQKAVTPSDTVDLPDGPCRALEVIATGDVTCIAADDANAGAVTRSAVAAGTLIEVRVRRVKATGTTATVLALY